MMKNQTGQKLKPAHKKIPLYHRPTAKSNKMINQVRKMNYLILIRKNSKKKSNKFYSMIESILMRKKIKMMKVQNQVKILSILKIFKKIIGTLRKSKQLKYMLRKTLNYFSGDNNKIMMIRLQKGRFINKTIREKKPMCSCNLISMSSSCKKNKRKMRLRRNSH